MKTLWLTALAAVSALSSAGSWAATCAVEAPPGLVQPGTLTVGTMLAVPPQAYSDNGTPAGFDIDLSKEIAAQMCLKVEFVNLAPAGLIPGLQAQKFDYLSAALGITPERQAMFDFVPYLVGGIQLVGQKKSKLSLANEEALCGMTVATIVGAVQARAVERLNKEFCPKDKQAELKYFPAYNDAVVQLRKGGADVAFVDWTFAAYITQLLPDLAYASPILSGRPNVPRNRLGLAFRKGEKPVDAVAQAVQNIKQNGTYDRLLAKWNLQSGDIRKVQ